jgi:prophage regulatory protein
MQTALIPDVVDRLPQIVSYPEVQKHLGVSRRTIERMVRKGEFPQPLQLAPNRVGWKIETVLGWIEAKKIWTLNDIKIADGDVLIDPNDPMIKRLTPYITAAAYANLLGRPVSTAELART